MSDPFAISRLALREATEKEIREALGDHESELIEWESLGLTFVCSVKKLVIVRAGAFGGDTRDIHGGWRYLFPQDVEKEWAEIKLLIPNFKRKDIKPR